jgi:putative addiction module component (TIGR02574 family)
MSTDELLEKTKHLSAEDQADLIEALMNQLDHADRNLELEWTVEARSRLEAYRQGKTP